VKGLVKKIEESDSRMNRIVIYYVVFTFFKETCFEKRN